MARRREADGADRSLIVKAAKAGTFLWVAFVSCILFLHLRADHVQRWDEAGYFALSGRFYQLLIRQGFLAFLQEFSTSRNQPALIAILPFPFYAIFGVSLASATLVNLAGFWVLCWSLFRAASSRWGETAGLAAIWLGSTFPLLIEYSRSFYSEYALASIVALTLLLMSRSMKADRKAEFALGACLGIGLLMKASFLLYVAAPAVVYFREKARHMGRRQAAASSAIIAGVGILIALVWYAKNTQPAISYILKSGMGSMARHYGDTRTMSPSVLLGYWKEVAGTAISLPHLTLIVAAAVYAGRRRLRSDPVVRMALLSFVLPFAAFSFGVAKDLRWLTPALPGLALASSHWIAAALGESKWRQLVACAWLLWPAIGSSNATLYRVSPRQSVGWATDGLLRRLSKRTGGAPATIACGFNHRDMNALVLNARAMMAEISISFVFLTDFEQPEEAFRRLKKQNVRCVLLARGIKDEGKPYLLEQLAVMRKRIESGRTSFQRIEELPLGPGKSLVLYGMNRSCRAVQ